MENYDNKVKETREKIIDFIYSQGGEAEHSDIKNLLGLERFKYYPFLDAALKTKRLIPLRSRGEIGEGLFLRVKPVVAYRLSDKEMERKKK